MGIALAPTKDSIEFLGLSFFDLQSEHYDALIKAMADEHRWHFENNDAESHMAFLRAWAPGLAEWSARLPFPQGSVHLDLGSGEGNLSYIVAQRGYHSIAVELSATILHSATLFQAGLQGPQVNEHASMDLWVADIYDLPLQNGSVDFVTIKEVLHHLDDLDGVMREVARVLKPNGMVYVWEPFYPGFSPLRLYMTRYVRPHELSLGVRHVYHSYKTYTELFGRWLTDVSIDRSYIRTKLQHYVTRNRFFQGYISAQGLFGPGREMPREASARRRIRPEDVLREDLLPEGLNTTRQRKAFLDRLLASSRPTTAL